MLPHAYPWCIFHTTWSAYLPVLTSSWPECCHAAGTSAASLLFVPPSSAITPIGIPAYGNMFVGAQVPASTTATITGFLFEGSTRIEAPGTAVAVPDPKTGRTIGSIAFTVDGKYTFLPIPGYMGPMPAINVVVRGSDGQIVVASLTIDVMPGEQRWRHMQHRHCMQVDG